VAEGEVPMGTAPDAPPLGTLLGPDDLIDDVRSQHHTPEDFDEGDLEDRLYAYRRYRLQNVPLDQIELDEWEVVEEWVADYVRRLGAGSEPPSPILRHDLGIIDGTHRLNALAQAGRTEVACWVGVR
jgi:hypothetical protein